VGAVCLARGVFQRNGLLPGSPGGHQVFSRVGLFSASFRGDLGGPLAGSWYEDRFGLG
jgi:hypothetical protein